MKVTKEVTVSGDLEATSLRVAQQTLTRLMSKVALPMARENAPGRNLPRSIKLGPVRMVGNGKFRVALLFPGRYGPVEFGSGVFVGEPAKRIKPRRWSALNTPYGYRKSVVWRGQPGQHFAERALEEVARVFPMEFAHDLNAEFSRGRGRKVVSRSHRG